MAHAEAYRIQFAYKTVENKVIMNTEVFESVLCDVQVRVFVGVGNL